MRKIVILIVMFITFIISVTISTENSQSVEQVLTSNEVKHVNVYFPRLPDFKFVAEKIEIENNINQEEKIEIVVNRLLAGNTKANFINVIPLGTKLNDISVENNTAVVDFSKEFVENHPGGSLGEYNTIYSIVNSITEIEGIEQVIFLIDGKEQETYKGHAQFDLPIGRDESMIVMNNSGGF